MISEKIDLYEYFKVERKGATGGFLDVIARTPLTEINPKIRPAILVIPGGGYNFLSDREGEPVALDFLADGYNAFVLRYSVNAAYPTPLLEACLAVAYIRANAQKLCTDAEHVAAAGFSAGGHLAGLLATLKDGELPEISKIAKNAHLNAVILSYPVVTMGEWTHSGSRDVICGGDEKLYEKLSVEKRADKNSAPAFIWHTFEDNCVPVKNSLLLAEAYQKAEIPFELHIFEKGWHGLSLSSDETSNQTEGDRALYCVGQWTKMSRKWLSSRGFTVKARQ